MNRLLSLADCKDFTDEIFATTDQYRKSNCRCLSSECRYKIIGTCEVFARNVTAERNDIDWWINCVHSVCRLLFPRSNLRIFLVLWIQGAHAPVHPICRWENNLRFYYRILISIQTVEIVIALLASGSAVCLWFQFQMCGFSPASSTIMSMNWMEFCERKKWMCYW